MKLDSFTNVLFFVFIIFKFETSSGGSLDRAYNVVQLMQKLVQDVRSSESFGNIASDLGNENIPTDKFYSLDSSLAAYNNASNSSCLRDLLYVAESINLRDFENSWAIQMLDSNGKLESGFLEGNTKWLGDFDECRSVYAPKKNFSNIGGFYGKYCSLQASPVNMSSVVISLGMCVPDTCDSAVLLKEYFEFINITESIPYLNKINSTVKVESLTCTANTRQISNAAIATICVLSIFLLLALMGSLITAVKYATSPKKRRNSLCENDVAVNHDSIKQVQDDYDDVLLFSEGSPTKLSVFLKASDSFLNCFCIFTNGAKLLNTDATEGQLLCLHGIRFLSMSWVILCHTYAFVFASVRNIRSVLSLIDTLSFQVVLNGFFSVDSFFVLSAFLMSYLYLQEAAKRKGNVNWLYFYVHRYLRLTPVYMLALGFFATIFPYLGSGPFWPQYDVEPLCQKHWWWNALYINNFEGAAEQCMAWSWYLANDMQFFAISPLFLITLWRWPKVGYSILAIFLFGTWAAAFIISYHYELVTGLGNVTQIKNQIDFMLNWTVYFDKLYVKPYTRIGPYLVGIALGYFLFKRKLTVSKTNNATLYIGWIVATALALTCVYGLYHTNPGLVLSSFYNSLSRTCYAACLSWVIFVCLTGQGGAVDKILSYKLFIPLSRLTYCAYLIHPMVITGYFGSLRTSLEFSHVTMIVLFMGMMLITYAISLLVSLLFESPVIRLEKFIRNKFQS